MRSLLYILVVTAQLLVVSCVYHVYERNEIEWAEVPLKIQESFLAKYEASTITQCEVTRFKNKINTYLFTLDDGTFIVFKPNGECIGDSNK